MGERLHSRAEVALQGQGGTGIAAVGLIWELGILTEGVAWGCHGLWTVTGNPPGPTSKPTGVLPIFLLGHHPGRHFLPASASFGLSPFSFRQGLV